MDSPEQPADYGYESDTEPTTDHSTAFDEQKAQKGARLLLEAMGRNPDGDGVADTWSRRVPEMLETLSEGARPEAKPVMRTFEAETDGLVVKTGIPLHSMCEHHMLPFQGVAHVAYRPGDEMVGLSKLIRYVRWRSRRLTTQETLTRDIATGLADELDAHGVAVELTATHMCEVMRGVETSTETTTRERVGTITEDDRDEFRASIRRHDSASIR